jgi:hypothetical protein
MQKRPQHKVMKIQVLDWDRHTNMAPDIRPNKIKVLVLRQRIFEEKNISNLPPNLSFQAPTWEEFLYFVFIFSGLKT